MYFIFKNIPFPFDRTDSKEMSNLVNGKAKNCVVSSEGGFWLKEFICITVHTYFLNDNIVFNGIPFTSQ